MSRRDLSKGQMARGRSGSATFSARDIALRPIKNHDVTRVAEFLHTEMNSRLTAVDWAAAMLPPWAGDPPNHGFMLICGDEIVGVNLAFYSVRTVDGEPEQLCNLGALCVRESARPHAVRLIRTILAQRGYHFTDLSPSGNVVELNRRLGFRELDTTTAMSANLPTLRKRHIEVIFDLDQIERRLTGHDHRIFLDHRDALAARHLLVVRGTEQCYIVFRKDRRKRLRIFASILYVSNRSLYATLARQIGSHLLLRHGALATLAESRVVGGPKPAAAYQLPKPRPKMYKSSRLPETEIDYLYSELTSVPW